MNAAPTYCSRRILVALAVLLIAAAALLFWFKLAPAGPAISDYRDAAKSWVEAHFVAGAALFFLLYFAVAALSIPVASGLTLIAGSLFGVATGTSLVLAASVSGATLAMLIARYLLRDLVQSRFHSAICRLDQGIERDGASHLQRRRERPVVMRTSENDGRGASWRGQYRRFRDALRRFYQPPGHLAAHGKVRALQWLPLA
jgi:hypothetical protein